MQFVPLLLVLFKIFDKGMAAYDTVEGTLKGNKTEINVEALYDIQHGKTNTSISEDTVVHDTADDNFKWKPRTPIKSDETDISKEEKQRSILTTVRRVYNELMTRKNSLKGLSNIYGEYVDFGMNEIIAHIDSDVSEEQFNNISFNLYTRHNPKKSQVLTKENLKKSNFNKNRFTKIVIHGWQSSAKSKHCIDLKNAYLKKYNYNIIIIDWSVIYSSKMYPLVVVLTKDVGKYIGKFVQALVDYGNDLKKIHIIGHSLGAHIAGFSQEAAPEKVSRITGLDPAGPGFYLGLLKNKSNGQGKLSFRHANFVDVIHTDIGMFGLGLPEAIGHIDFYPNQEEPRQPGCDAGKNPCSHTRAWYYFIESITEKFLASSCNAIKPVTVLMGDPTPTTAHGIYCLKTNAKPPFALSLQRTLRFRHDGFQANNRPPWISEGVASLKISSFSLKELLFTNFIIFNLTFKLHFIYG